MTIIIGTTIAATGTPDPTGPIINKLTISSKIKNKVTVTFSKLRGYLVKLCFNLDHRHIPG